MEGSKAVKDGSKTVAEWVGRAPVFQILVVRERRAIGSVEMDVDARRDHCGRRWRKAADHRTAQRPDPSCKQSLALICVSAPGDDKVARPSGVPLPSLPVGLVLGPRPSLLSEHLVGAAGNYRRLAAARAVCRDAAGVLIVVRYCSLASTNIDDPLLDW
uniref:Uncharacterized protein n=1 Tax=Plectus sambesii TaxID=2011161 RepID=A0A914W4V0_9BILA